jgi:hypothetical protein
VASIIQLKELKRDLRLKPVQLRLPTSITRDVKSIVSGLAKQGDRVTESDIYRTAIINFVNHYREDKEGNSPMESIDKSQ